jgi:hypothetical protein
VRNRPPETADADSRMILPCNPSIQHPRPWEQCLISTTIAPLIGPAPGTKGEIWVTTDLLAANISILEPGPSRFSLNHPDRPQGHPEPSSQMGNPGLGP